MRPPPPRAKERNSFVFDPKNLHNIVSDQIFNSFTLNYSKAVKNPGASFDLIYILIDMLTKYLALFSFICARCLKRETSCLKVMLRNLLMKKLEHLLL